MRYVGFGVGHIDKSVRADPPWTETGEVRDFGLELASEEFLDDELDPDVTAELHTDHEEVQNSFEEDNEIEEEENEDEEEDEPDEDPEFNPDVVDDEPLAEF